MSASESERLLAGKNGERLRASIAQLGGWQPIETAPRDGTPILGVSGSTMTTVEWDGDIGGYWSLIVCGSYAEDGEWWPTHWMPLPNPPA
jgi:hypothetical protein